MNRRTPLLIFGALLILATGSAGALAVTATTASVDVPAELLTSDQNETNESLSAHATVRGGASTGEDVAGGDVDGDGSGDVLVGQPFNDEAGNNGGAAYLFYAPVDDGEYDTEDADVTILGSGGGQWMGYDVNVVDVDGDGYGDLVVSAPLQDGGNVYIFYGSPDLSGTLTPSDADVMLSSADQDEQLGLAVEPVDRDGGAGLVVGAPRSDVDGTDAGAAYYFESPTEDRSTADADLRLVGAEQGDRAGWDVDGSDLDGDGTVEVAVGARGADDSAGAAYVVPANRSGTRSLADADVVLRGASAGDRAGHTVTLVETNESAGIAVGAPNAEPNGTNSGATYVLPTESADLSDVDPTFTGAPGEQAGWDVAVGDLTCDGNPDLLVGAPAADNDAGAAYLVRDASDASRIQSGESPGDYAGYRVALVANATGEETRDALVGAPHENTTNVTGHAYLLAGECAVDTAPVENETTGGENGTAANGTDGNESDGTEDTEETAGAATDSDDATSSNDLSFGLVPAGLAVVAALATVVAVALWRRSP
jgi:hypothetical protein